MAFSYKNKVVELAKQRGSRIYSMTSEIQLESAARRRRADGGSPDLPELMRIARHAINVGARRSVEAWPLPLALKQFFSARQD
ncbi:MAG TPA: hypothetical protein VMV87_03140 [Burkholderiales bacterium]|nr:hypothetical protein [Burkholderiales bacterium]